MTRVQTHANEDTRERFEGGQYFAQGVTQKDLDWAAYMQALEAKRDVDRAQGEFERPIRLANEALATIQDYVQVYPRLQVVASELTAMRQEARDARDKVWVDMEGFAKCEALEEAWDKVKPF